MDVFISYSRSDRERVNHIAKGLEAEGYSVWWDRDIRAGEEFDDVIDKAIKKAKVIIVVWSKDSISSNWVKEEAEDGVEDNKLVPALIDMVVIPRGFRRIQAAELQDGGDDPTASRNWPEFLDSVRKIAGKGDGSGSSSALPSDAELATLVRHGAPQSPPPAAAAPKPAEAKPAASKADNTAGSDWKSRWPIAAGIVGVLLAGLLALQMFGGGVMGPGDPEDMTPVVLGIYPSDSFGVDQRLGLRVAFSDSDIEIIDLAAPLDAMKGRDAPEVLEGLRNLLANRNVIAIVGPSITEFTPSVLEVVRESGRNPAIVLTTAASRRDIGWEESGLALFRVGSGVDERAQQFAMMASRIIESGTDVVLLYESVPSSADKTYGELFFMRIKDFMGDDWNQWVQDGSIRDIPYYRGSIMDSFSRPQQRAIFDEPKMVVLVGLSSDYRDLARNFYDAGDQPRAAILGGWNTSTSLLALSKEMPLQHRRLFDMTDVYLTPPDSVALPSTRRFQREFGTLSPALRQEAVAYDSGLVIKLAAEQMGDDVTADGLVAILRDKSFSGVTGEIAFGTIGQNEGEAGGTDPLHRLRLDPGAERWEPVTDFDALLRATQASE